MENNVLDVLRPQSRHLVMDLVEEAGLDVSDWSNYKGKHPASNPKYCYEWVFAEEDKIAACIWFRNMEVTPQGHIAQRIDLWPIIKRHENKGGKPTAARRARSLDMALQRAFRDQLPVRAIVVDGDQADIEKEPDQTSLVRTRLLDIEPWSVAEYDWITGQCLLIRGRAETLYVDQFTTQVTSNSERVPRQGFVYERSTLVRQLVLARAAGSCELCGARGFETATGGVYLETHHVVPLCESGEDSTSNVAALCPDHHRQAHFGKSRESIRDTLTIHLEKFRAA